jgi:hypothetical protein
MKNTKIDTSVIMDLINKYPNDMELGKKIRAYFLEVDHIEIEIEIDKDQEEIIQGPTKL